MLFDLPKVCLVPILSTWIEIDDLAALDTAICCKEFREIFLRLISLDEFVFDTTVLHESIGYFFWLSIRSLKVKDISLNKIKSSSLFNKFAKPVFKRLKAIRKLVVNADHCFQMDLNDYCNKIESLEIIGGDGLLENTMEGIFSKISGVRFLDISSAFHDLVFSENGNEEGVCSSIAHLFPLLESYIDDILETFILIRGISLLKQIELTNINAGDLSVIAEHCPLLESCRFAGWYGARQMRK